MAWPDEDRHHLFEQRLRREREGDLDRLASLAAVDRQDTVRRQVGDRFVELEIRAEFGACFPAVLRLPRLQDAFLPHASPDRLADAPIAAEAFGQDVARAGEGVLGGTHLARVADELGRLLRQVGPLGRSGPGVVRERRQAAFGGDGGRGPPAGFRQLQQVPQQFGLGRPVQGLCQLVRQEAGALGFAADALAQILKGPQFLARGREAPQPRFVETARRGLAVVGNEG